jgi:3-oxoacyl-[acyl-carrier protein] reductase
MKLKLEQKVVLITGSGQGLGKGIAEAFLSEGAKVVITDLLVDRLDMTRQELSQKYNESNVLSFCGDLTKNSDIIDCVNTAINYFGKIDILIANLGSGSSVPDWNVTDDEWKRMLDINFESARKVTTFVVPHMIKKGRGNLLFISSIAGKEVIGAPLPYTVAKAAIIAYSKDLSVKLASKNIRTNVICPGNIYFKNGDWDRKLRADKQKVESMIEDKVPLNRFTSPEEVANLALFLASEKSSFITGSSITIDGGQTVSI